MAVKPVKASLSTEEVRTKAEYTSSVKLRNQNYFQEKVKRIAEDNKESNRRWYKDHPGQQPGWNSNRTWKTFSRVRYGSEEFRERYDDIDWS